MCRRSKSISDHLLEDLIFISSSIVDIVPVFVVCAMFINALLQKSNPGVDDGEILCVTLRVHSSIIVERLKRRLESSTGRLALHTDQVNTFVINHGYFSLCCLAGEGVEPNRLLIDLFAPISNMYSRLISITRHLNR